MPPPPPKKKKIILGRVLTLTNPTQKVASFGEYHEERREAYVILGHHCRFDPSNTPFCDKNPLALSVQKSYFQIQVCKRLAFLTHESRQECKQSRIFLYMRISVTKKSNKVKTNFAADVHRKVFFTLYPTSKLSLNYRFWGSRV